MNLPMCPWCEEPVSDDPSLDFPSEGEDFATECGACGQPVLVSVSCVVEYRVVKDEAMP